MAECKRDGADRLIPDLAKRLLAACQPAEPSVRNQRLSAVGLVLAPNRPEAEATLWLHETARLLSDLPGDILSAAVDEHQRTNRFLPTVAEIRAIAEPQLARRRRAAARLDALARLIASGEAERIRAALALEAPAPELSDEERAKPEEVAALVDHIGERLKERGERLIDAVPLRPKMRSGPPKLPSRQDYLDMGVSADVLDRMEGVAP